MKDYLAQSYDRSAEQYDEKFRTVQYEKFSSLILPYKSFLEQKTLIDIGCGTGLLFEFLNGEGIKHSGLGIDLSRNMLLVAQDKRQGTFVQADMYKLPVKNASADVVASFTAINIFPDAVDLILAETGRVLKTGGMLILSVLKSGFNDVILSEILEHDFKIEIQKPAGQDIGLICVKKSRDLRD